MAVSSQTRKKNVSLFYVLVLAVAAVCVLRMSLWKSGARTALPAELSTKPSVSEESSNGQHESSPKKDHAFVFALTAEENEAAYNEIFPTKPLCQRNQVIDGKWVPETLDKPPYVTPTVHLRCYPPEVYKTSPWKSWRWQPNDSKDTAENTCDLTKWSHSAFCDVMRGATVLITGDSLSWEHYSSLVQLNGLLTKQGYQHQSNELRMNIYQSLCKGHTRVAYRRDDKLLNLTDSIQSTFPTVLVLNRGAHYVNDTELLPRIRHNLEEVRNWLDTCRDTYKMKCHFFWRTTVPGHPECGTFSKPVNNLELMESRVSDLSFYNNRSIRFHWYDYQHQNQLVLEELDRSGLPYRVIDAYYLNMRRPDEHRAHQDDCLHNCYPGKMDVYNQLLLHYLRMDRSREDIKQSQLVAKQNNWRLDETTFYDRNATMAAKEKRTKKGH